MSRASAQHLASYGRKGDTELVHMSKDEIKGLQGLALAHGGSLTINPDTGLVEAGFLRQILPMVAGAALASTGVGAPLAALMVGGGYGIATGSLEKGLIAGLGAYGGAGLASGLASAGTSAAVEQGGAQAVQAAAEQSGTQLAANTAAPGVEAALTSPQIQASNALNTQAFPNLGTEQISGLRQASLNAANPMDVVRAAGQGNASLAPSVTSPTFGQNIASMGRGLPQIGNVVMQSPTTAMAAAAPFLSPDQPSGYTAEEYDENDPYRMRLSRDFQGSTPVRPNPYYRAQYPTFAAGGGLMGGLDQSNNFPQGQQVNTQFATPTQMPTSAEVVRSDYAAPTNPYSGQIMGMQAGGVAQYKNKGQVNVLQDYLERQEQQQMRTLPESVGVPRTGIFRDTDVDTARKDALTAAMIRLGKVGKSAGIKPIALPKTSIKGLGDIRGATPEIETAAAGGTMRYNLGGYSDGGRMLKGPGDGMSDSIPASIAGKQPARLADGEFVVPADVVSHLGNGSTDAGAKKLYAMMAKIRKARTGKKKQAPAVKAAKYMPV
jgi:hypothetical protein